MAHFGSISIRAESSRRSWRVAARRRATGLTPGVEPLEGRVVPSTITVTNTNDSGLDSLRSAITQANTDPAQDTITFAPAVTGTITLLSALPDLSSDINMSGPGSSTLTVARGTSTPDFRIFTVDAGAQVTL